ncbi:hypothetical protein GCM10007108_07190 [Thermogymnomonas acidicola]|uniref:Uncharacterized protein n=1 Tax=Thermogymnomonas acidicola TaxID=399579 RepID=A0AA37F976_9ARCH|nr:hypothetical protein [Thermogymnomonas acidicola]GGM71638.1 hypothetical protein GCM10007108_07190 [Thermogymnomonas acidicola]
MDFNEAWYRILDFARTHKSVKTLVRKTENEIVGVSESEIRAVSSVRRRGRLSKERVLRKEEFEIAWNMLFSKGSVSSRDISPVLMGRRLIILALMARALGLEWKTRPVTVFIGSEGHQA